MTATTPERRALSILGTRGIPAAHGGFETFAQHFALHMRDQGWNVTVYCQTDTGPGQPMIDYWEGVRRVSIAANSGALGTIKFDWACTLHAISERGVMIVLGYNTAVFSAILRLTGKSVLMNMDGIEWQRRKWRWYARAWLYLNEWVGAVTSTKLIADHPAIAQHLKKRRRAADVVTIPYGANAVLDAPISPVVALGLTPGRYLISVGRIEPENNILPMIEAFAARPRDLQYVCLGRMDAEKNPYDRQIVEAAKGRVLFAGAIYDPAIVKALRFHAAAYCHGHSVGGTNPSLVEALAAGNAIISHDNLYNRWVAGNGQFYFADASSFAAILDRLEAQPQDISHARQAARVRHEGGLMWPPVLSAYEEVCEAALDKRAPKSSLFEPWLV